MADETTLRKRVTFSSNAKEDEDDRILDEQEQEELIQQLKERSDKQSSQYKFQLQLIVVLSLLLHIIYFFQTPPRYSPFEAVFPSDTYAPAMTSLPSFALLHILVHIMALVRLLSPDSPLRVAIAASCPPLLSFTVLFSASSIAPTICLMTLSNWRDLVWWAVPEVLVLFLWATGKWVAEEADSIQELESLRYDAKGA